MTVRAELWQYAPRQRLATVALVGAWASSGVLLLLILAMVWLSGPYDPDDLTPQMWQEQAKQYEVVRTAALIAMTPLTALAATATIGGLLRRWGAPLICAAGMWPGLCVVTLAATVGLNQSIDTALERAAQPPKTITEPSSPPPAQEFTTSEVDAAVGAGVELTIEAATSPVVLADGTPLTESDQLAVESETCDSGGTAATASVAFRTGDNIASEEAILTAWATPGFTKDRAAGTNLLYGNETDPISRVSLRGDSRGVLHLTIESRCATR